MNIEFHKENIKRDQNTFFLVIDFIMLGLIIINLLWIIFDTAFSSKIIQDSIQWLSADFHDFYLNTVHNNFTFYDLIFVSIFLFELGVRWIVAIVNKTYHRWFFYPFVHWYDVLGCIPIGSFRFLRLLRVISILYRLQKLGIFDFRNTYPYQFVQKYYGVLVEEVSDRVVVNVLDGVQDEVNSGTPLVNRIIDEALLPRRSEITEWVNSRIGEIIDHNYVTRKPELRDYIRDNLAVAVERNKELGRVMRLPIVGGAIADLVENTLADLISDIVDQIVMDIRGDESTGLMHDVTDTLFNSLSNQEREIQLFTNELLTQILELVKDEVKVQKWKQKSEAE